MPKVKLLFLSVFLFLLSACSHFADGNRVSAPSFDNKSISPMKTPPGMAISFDTLYPLPQRNYPSHPKPVDLSPPTLSANKNIGSGWFSW